MTRDVYKLQGARRFLSNSPLSIAKKMINFCLLRSICRFLFAAIATILMFDVGAIANTVGTVEKSYLRSDYKECVSQAQIAVKNKPSIPDAARIMKFMGICHFMLKNKTSAASAFRSALKLNNELKLTTDEVLDLKAIDFFYEQKTFVLSQLSPNRVKNSSAFADSASKTTLIVNSNVKGKVSINGIYAGPTGKKIDADSGPLELTLYADGYRTKKLNVKVVKNRENLVSVQLTKWKPSSSLAAGSARGIANGNKPSKMTNKKRPPPVPSDDLFSEEPSLKPAVSSQPDLIKEFQNETSANLTNYQPQVVFLPAPMTDPLPPSYSESGVDDFDPKKLDDRHLKQKKGSMLTSLLPFGAGQFQNNDDLIGLVFLGAESAALGYSIWKLVEYFQGREEAQEEINNIGSKTRNQLSIDHPQYSDEQIESEVSAAQKYYAYGPNGKSGMRAKIEKAHLNAQYGLYAFGGLWAIGVIHAMMNNSPTLSTKIQQGQLKKPNIDKPAFAWTQHDRENLQVGLDINIDSQTWLPGLGIGLNFQF